jgi:hypothetical protein
VEIFEFRFSIFDRRFTILDAGFSNPRNPRLLSSLSRKTIGVMNTLPVSRLFNLAALAAAALLVTPTFAQDEKKTSPTAATSPVAATQPKAAASPDEADIMTAMLELAKPGDNHKLLASLAGSWTNVVKMWMNPDPKAPPIETTGTATRTPAMDGRYFIAEFKGTVQLPGPGGKMKELPFTGMSIEGYDNVKQKFVVTWIDNMGTGMEFFEGTYDPANKTFNYTSEIEPMPGMKTKVREVLTIIDSDHHKLEWYEDRGGTEARTMQIDYTRAGKAK